MAIGTIVKSNSHVSYLCRVYGKLETEQVPAAEEHAFGTFVGLRPVAGTGIRLIGIISDTQLINPEYGELGPRLSPDTDLAVLSPDYLNEKGILVGIDIVGWDDGQPHHAVPAIAAQIGTVVEPLSFEEVCAFHRGMDGAFRIGYLPRLITGNDPMMASLLLAVLDRMDPAFPSGQKIIAVLRNNVAWKARVVPAG